MKENQTEQNLLQEGQLNKYAEDLAAVYRSEKEKRRKLEAANRALQQTAEELRESESRYKTLFNSAGDAIFIHDLQGRFLEVNDAACRLLGYSREKLSAMSLPDVEDWENSDIFADRLKELQQEKRVVAEALLLCRDNAVIPAEINCRLIEYRQKTAVLIIARDIRERIQILAEQEKIREQLRHAQRLESLGIMASGIAHDLNNILFPILGYTEMALDEIPENSIAGSFLKNVIRTVHMGRALVAQILAFARKSEGQKMPVNISDSIHEVLTLLKNTLPSAVQLQENLSPLSGAVMADPTHIRQIIMNLCINAYQSMSAEGGVLQIESGEISLGENSREIPDLSPGSYVRFSVRDTGCGMEAGVLERIFEPYFTTKNKEEGSGMGLATVYGIVKNLKGAIRVESIPGTGTCFFVYLPISATETVAENAEKKTDCRVPGGNEHILIVDDEQSHVAMVSHMLRRAGYRVSGKNSGSEALDFFQAQADDIDLVLSDQHMPGISGYDMALKIREIRKDTPVIICSGREECISGREAGEAGIRDHLIKPVTRDLLLSRIRQILDQDKKKILVVDDDPEIREMLRLMLQRSGYEVIEAENGKAGIHLCNIHSPDLVISDMLMPEKRGVDMIYELIRAFPEIRIIAISGGGSMGMALSLKTAADLGAVRTYEKPLPREELLAAVREILQDQ